MAPTSSAKQPTNFALLVEEKLGRLSQWNRMITENIIIDILFEIKINEFEGRLHQVVRTNQLPATQINQLPNQPALHMNQHISTQPNANLPYPGRNSTHFSHEPNVFFRLCKKNSKRSLYLNIAFTFTNNVIFQTLKVTSATKLFFIIKKPLMCN